MARSNASSVRGGHSFPVSSDGIDTILVWCHIPLMPTVVSGDFEWDDAKAASNLAKHGVAFDEAVTALVDPYAVYVGDSANPGCFIAIGMSVAARVLCVVHVERGARE